MSNASTTREDTGAKVAMIAGWLLFFGLLGIAVSVLVRQGCKKLLDQEHLRWSQALIARQLQQITQGEIHCLVHPDPNFINELLDDPECAARVCELNLGGDVSDERLGRLRELPNLKCIVFLFADNPDVFLERMQGMATIEELSFVRTIPSRCGIEFMSNFPRIKSLSLPVKGKNVSDLNGIKNHPSIENLVLTWTGCDRRVLPDLLPLLQSLPRLRSVMISDAETDEKLLEESLRNALPNCQCSVGLGR